MVWGNNCWSSSISGSSSEQREPEGTHRSSCMTESGWGNNGWSKGHYDSKCSGCCHDRVKSMWGGKSNSSKNATGALRLIGGAFVARKSLWG